VGPGPTSVAVSDLNGDGRPDVVVGNRCPSSGDCTNGIVSVLLGEGDGTFRAPVNYGTGGWNFTFTVAIVDLNVDGKPDLVVSNNFTLGGWPIGSVSVLLGNGDGTFQPAVNYNSGGSIALSVAAGDLNGDGKPDLVVVDSGSPVSVLLGKGDGTFHTPVTYPAGCRDPYSVAIGDVNGDGKPDVVLTNDFADAPWWQRGSVSVLLGNGDGSLQAPITYDSGGFGATSIAIADVNGDGHPDLVVANYTVSNWQGNAPGLVSVLPGNGDGTFRVAVNYPSGGLRAFSVAVVDVNADRKPDLVVTNEYNYSYPRFGTMSVLLNNLTIPTTTALTSSPNPSFLNQLVSFTATITSTRPIPDGQVVTFYDGTTAIASRPTVGGAANFSTSFLSAATHGIRAAYPGDLFHVASSRWLSQVVDGYPTSTTFNSSLNPSIYGQKVTFMATVTTEGPLPPTGSVAFTWGGFIPSGPRR